MRLSAGAGRGGAWVGESWVGPSGITAWVAAASPDLLAALGVSPDRCGGRRKPPHPDTIERVFAGLGAQGLAEHLGAFLAGRAGIAPVGAPIGGPVLLPAIAVDGKAMRGAIGPDGQIPYLLAAATHHNATVIAERLVGAKSNEVPAFQSPMPAWIPATAAGSGAPSGCWTPLPILAFPTRPRCS